MISDYISKHQFLQYLFHIVLVDVLGLQLLPILFVEVIVLHTRIRSAREKMGYTRERFAEALDVSVSYLAELERGRTGISVKLLKKVCLVLGLSADYILFGKERTTDALLLDKIHRLDEKYLPLLDGMLTELLSIKE